MPKVARKRIDYQPGQAAREAITVARQLFPDLGTQELIDRLVITGLAALKHPPFAPPQFFGSDRDRWRLPETLQAKVSEPAER